MFMWEILIKNDEEFEIIEFIFLIFFYKFVRLKSFMDRFLRYMFLELLVESIKLRIKLGKFRNF